LAAGSENRCHYFNHGLINKFMNKTMKDDPIEGYLQQGVEKNEIRDALLQMKKVKKRKKGLKGKEGIYIPKSLTKKLIKSLNFKWQSPPRIIIKIENHFHSNVDNVIE
jgi:hypothetical protein